MQFVVWVHLSAHIWLAGIFRINIFYWLLALLYQFQQFLKQYFLFVIFELYNIQSFKYNKHGSSRVERMNVVLALYQRSSFFLNVMEQGTPLKNILIKAGQILLKILIPEHAMDHLRRMTGYPLVAVCFQLLPKVGNLFLICYLICQDFFDLGILNLMPSI